MELFVKKGAKTKVFSVTYDEEKLKKIVDMIVKSTSYREKGTFFIPVDSNVDRDKLISQFELPNGDPMFEDITSIKDVPSDISNNGPSIKIKATKVVVPQLASIINRLLAGDPESIRDLLLYEKSSELLTVEEMYSAVDKKYASWAYLNFEDTRDTIDEINAIGQRCSKNQVFNVERLKELYTATTESIQMQLDREIMHTKGRTSSLEEYLSSKKRRKELRLAQLKLKFRKQS